MTAPRTGRGMRTAARRRQRRRSRFAYSSALATGVVLVLVAARAGGVHRPQTLAMATPRPSTAGAAAPPVTLSPTTPASTTASRQPWTVLALGDSVPAGTACDCTPFPTLYAADVAQLSGRATTSVNLAKPGLTSGGLLAQLAPGTDAAADLAQASVITVTIGANDFAYQPSVECPRLRCYEAQLAAMQANVGALLRLVADARGARPTSVIILGYWEVWEDGQVGVGRGGDYMAVNDALTAGVNRGLAAVAAAGTATYVNLRTAFHPLPGEDDTDLLAADGDHPNAAGHVAIARALQALGLPPALRSPTM